MIRIGVMIVLGALLCGVAAADPGQEHSARGQTLYREGKYREAHGEFTAGYEASKLPAFVFNMAECSRLAGDFDTARDEYTKYLALEPNSKLAPLVNQRLAALPPRAPAPAPPPTSPATSPATSPVTSPATSPPAVPAPAIAAKRLETADPARPLAPSPVDQPTPLWKRKAAWIAVGAALAAGTVAAIVMTRGDNCAGTCIDWRMP